MSYIIYVKFTHISNEHQEEIWANKSSLNLNFYGKQNKN